MYVPVGSVIVDPTYGRGVFYKNVDLRRHTTVFTDLGSGGPRLEALPYENDSADAFVLDPPYLNGGVAPKTSLNKCYKNPGHNSYQAVLRMYLRGSLEAHRVLRQRGVLIVKCQPCVADHRQYPIHAHLTMTLPLFGLEIIDEFLLISNQVPIMRHARQQHARKNHSYFLVFKKTR